MSPIYGGLVDVTGGYSISNLIVIGSSILTTVLFILFTNETYGGKNSYK
jgi:hypothetical protein